MGNKLGGPKKQQQQQQYQQQQQQQQYQPDNNIEYSNISQEAQGNYQQQHVPMHSITKLNSKPQDEKKQTVAVIVTFQQSSSYDNLFSAIEQKTQEGTKVCVYQCSCYSIDQISQAFDGKFANQTYKELVTEINKVDPDCVVFNWECCSFYSTEAFNEGPRNLFKFVKRMIDKKFLCMFSDFSLKALIKQWEKSILGPNPFVKTGETAMTVELRFKAGQLKECPSAQLQTVGEMAEQGKVNVHCMGGTIIYSVNKKNLNHDQYKIQVLTVVNNIKAKDDNLKCEIGEFNGNAGHVMVKYPSGGAILTSMTHWVELMKVDTSEQKLFEVASRQYGVNYANEQKMMYDNMDQSQKVNWRAQKATQFIQNQAPCQNMKRKAR